MGVNEREDVCYRQPTTLAERVAIANDFLARSGYRIPIMVDDMDNAAEEAFAAWPERLYVIDEAGKVVYKGDVGPFGFDPEELGAWLGDRLTPGAGG